MTSCREFLLDDLMAIVAIPVTDIPASDVSSPSNALTPTISNEDFTPPLTNSLTIGVLPAIAGGALILGR